MKVIIHFGPPKTGTSAIQAWCQNNRDVLEKHGIYYPEHKLDRNAISSGNHSAIYHSGDNGEKKLSKSRIKETLATAEAGGFKTVLLSSEYFFARLPDIIKELPDAQFLGYVRDPLNIIDSNYNQSVKRHGNTSKIPLTKNLNHSLLARLRDYLGKYPDTKFDLRAYHLEVFKEQNIVFDFLNYLGIDIDLVSINAKINPSYTHSALEVKRWLNRLELGTLNHRVDNILQRFDDDTREYTVIPTTYYKKYKTQAIKLLDEFSKAYAFESGELMIQKVRESDEQTFLDQDLPIENFKCVVDFIKEQDRDVYDKLRVLVKNHYGTLTVEERSLLFYKENRASGIINKIKKRSRAN